jgi:Ca2+-binding EF-hand superfamily protein
MTTAEKQKAFDTIDVNGNGTIEFKEWYKHFDKLIREKKSTWTAEKLLILYRKYEGDSKGINFDEYNSFMDDVLGKG